MTETKAEYVIQNASDHSMLMLAMLHDVEEYLASKEATQDLDRRRLLLAVREVITRVQYGRCEHDWELVERSYSVAGRSGYEIYRCRKCGEEHYEELRKELPE